jgi:hypothetical protein
VLTLASIFLYLFLLGCTIGVGYFFYTIWIVPYFPQKKKSGTGSRRPTEKKKIDTGVTSDSDTPAVGATTSSKPYNEEWIPSHHIQRPEAKRAKSGTRPKSKGKE